MEKKSRHLIRHTIYTISLRRFSIMEATGDKRMACRIPIFPNWCYKNLMYEIGVEFNPEIIDDDILKLTLYNRITLYRAALIIKSYDDDNKYINDWLQKILGTTSVKRLEAETERIEKRYMELSKEKEHTGDFEDVVSGVEVILGYSLNRNISIYEFTHLYKMAINKAEKAKKNGAV